MNVLGMGQFHFDPATYLAMMREEIPTFDELQEATAEATRGIRARRILELGTGTGETTRRLLDRHPGAELVGIDASEDMIGVARSALAADLRVRPMEDPLPEGPFDLVVSALAVHHLDAAGKRDLFRRVRGVLLPGARFVLADVVVPERPEDAVTPLSPDFDLPDRLDELLDWLREAGFEPRVAWAWKDLAVIRADVSGG